jgi:hypothetical protein
MTLSIEVLVETMEDVDIQVASKAKVISLITKEVREGWVVVAVEKQIDNL